MQIENIPVKQSKSTVKIIGEWYFSDSGRSPNKSLEVEKELSIVEVAETINEESVVKKCEKTPQETNPANL